MPLSLLASEKAQPLIMGLLALLAVIGVFALFAGAVGIIEFAGKASRNESVRRKRTFGGADDSFPVGRRLLAHSQTFVRRLEHPFEPLCSEIRLNSR